MRPDQTSLTFPKETVAEQAAAKYRAIYRTYRRDGDLTIFVLGWGMAGGHTGHLVRAWLPDVLGWSAPYALKTTAALLATVPTDLPPGAEPPEEPKK